MHTENLNSLTTGFVKMDYSTLMKDSFVPAD